MKYTHKLIPFTLSLTILPFFSSVVSGKFGHPLEWESFVEEPRLNVPRQMMWKNGSYLIATKCRCKLLWLLWEMGGGGEKKKLKLLERFRIQCF